MGFVVIFDDWTEMTEVSRSISLDALLLDDLAPLGFLRPEHLHRFVRVFHREHQALVGGPLSEGLGFGGLAQGGMQLPAQRHRRAASHEQAVPIVGLVAGNARLGKGRNLGQQRRPLAARDRQGSQIRADAAGSGRKAVDLPRMIDQDFSARGFFGYP